MEIPGQKNSLNNINSWWLLLQELSAYLGRAKLVGRREIVQVGSWVDEGVSLQRMCIGMEEFWAGELCDQVRISGRKLVEDSLSMGK